MFRRVFAPALTAVVALALIHPPHTSSTETAQVEPRPIERPQITETKPEIRKISVSRSQERKPAIKLAPKPIKTEKKQQTPTSSGWDAGDWDRFPAWVEQSARCIAKHESWNQGLWKAINPNTRVSTASGFAQWTNPTWRAQTARAGIGEQFGRAVYAPPRIQAAVFAHQAQNYGLYPWKGTGCPGT